MCDQESRRHGVSVEVRGGACFSTIHAATAAAAAAGANLALVGRSRLGEDDGILTAGEVAGLDLVGTSLVVLSACDTGLGEARSGEGVMGLRRAFVQAGASSLVVSLWQVPDAATRQLMGGFYRKHLDGQSVWQALLAAQREAITDSRKCGGEPNPVLWAGFVASEIRNR